MTRHASAGHVRPANERSGAATVELVAELANVRIAASELIGLRVGDIITTETSIDSPLVITVDGQPRFHARPGAYRGCKAVSIEEQIESPDHLA